MTLNEAQIIGVLAQIFGTNHRGVQVGIGDDAAVVATGKHTVITTDMAVKELTLTASGQVHLKLVARLLQQTWQISMPWVPLLHI